MSPPSLSLPKKLFFSGLFFILILLAAEFLLSLAGLEKYDQLFMPKSSYPIFVPGKGEMADHYVTNPHFGAYINAQSFLREKPVGLTRIFVVGGSAAYGFPFTEEYGFSGYLRRALDKVAPGRFEIINASGMSFGSHRVLDVLKDVVRLAPDIVIIYSGNNEYVERNVLPAAKSPPAPVEKISTLLNQTDIYRAVRLGMYKAVPRVFDSMMKQDITDIRSNPQVNRGDIGRNLQTDSAILANYRNNIGSMKELLIQQGVKVIVCTVPVDVGGWLPTSGMPQFPDEAAAKKWVELVDFREAAFARGNTALEAEYMQEILKITPNDPGMLFNYGKVLWMLGKYEASYEQAVRAKDFDYRPIRALSTFNEVVRSAVDNNRGVYLADLEQMVRDLYIRGQAKGFFIDYCHLTEKGHKLVGGVIPSVLAEMGELKEQDISSISALIQDDRKAEEKSNFVRGHELYALALTHENNGRLDLEEKTYLEALKYLPDFDQIYANLGHLYAGQNELRKAEEMYGRALQINPKNHLVHLSLGYMRLQDGVIDEAEHHFITAINITSELPGAYSGLGDVAMERGKFREAIKYYTESLRLGQDSVWLRESLAKAYLSLGDHENAIRNWEQVLRFAPFDQETKALIEKYSRKN
jgi:tetratricopeptide (TPR) repeat protein